MSTAVPTQLWQLWDNILRTSETVGDQHIGTVSSFLERLYDGSFPFFIPFHIRGISLYFRCHLYWSRESYDLKSIWMYMVVCLFSFLIVSNLQETVHKPLVDFECWSFLWIYFIPHRTSLMSAGKNNSKNLHRTQTHPATSAQVVLNCSSDEN